MMTRLFDRRIFFREVRLSIFRGRMSRAQVAGLKHLLTVWEREHANDDVRWLAYCLATAWHETAHTMQPVRETLAKSERQAIARLRAWAHKLKGRRRQTVLAYSRVHADTGHAYFGRGYVQITWRRNYRRLGAHLGLDLERNPELVMKPEIAARILFIGMIEGLFTAFRLTTFINGERCDYVQARRVVNGMDKAALIAGVAEEFHAALTAAGIAQRAGIDVAEAEREAMTREPEEAEKGAAVLPVPAPPPEVIAGRELPDTGKPVHRSTTIMAAFAALLTQIAATAGSIPPAIKWGVPIIGALAMAWIIRERIRHAREDGI